LGFKHLVTADKVVSAFYLYGGIAIVLLCTYKAVKCSLKASTFMQILKKAFMLELERDIKSD
jgi:hypothetical protein